VRKPGFPAYIALGSVHQGLAYVGLPLLAARRHRGAGWRRGRPGALNLVGLLPVGAGLAAVEWAIVSHFRTAPDDAGPTAMPDYLVSTGAYARSRNPLYVGGLTAWLGSAWFLGSRRAAIAALSWAAGIAIVGVPFEERMLEAKFGDSYRAYRDRVPRWL
jgi:protein-S-isoprenylcysteine O-methyltransferase Ste14